jgi:putative transposase
MGKGRALTPLHLTQRQKGLLEKHHARRSTPDYQRARIAIVLGAYAGKSNLALAQALQMNVKRVDRWRRRWIGGYQALCEFEQGPDGQGVSDLELLSQMLSLLKDAARPGAPKVITLEQEQQIRALACENPSNYGIPVTHWTHELLSIAAQQQGIIEQISPRYVGVILKKKRAPTA